MAQAVQVDFLISGQVDSSGNRLDAGTVTFYETDGTTLKTIWEDGAKATTASNPYTLSSAGTAQLFADGIYVVVVKTSGGATVREVTNAYFNPNDTTADVGYIDASEYGSGDDANAISLAITAAAGSDKTVLLKPKNWDIDDDLTIPTNINLLYQMGAYTTVATSKTLTFSGTYEAPLYNVFRGAGTITIDDRNLDIPSIHLVSGTHDSMSHYGLRTYLNGIKVTSEDSTLPGHFQANDDGVNKEVFRFDRISASPADNDTNDISFYSENDNNQQAAFGKLQYKMLDVSDGTEKGEISLWVADGVDGSVDQMFVLDIDGAQLNGNLTLYDAVNDASPTVFLGSATAEKLSIQSVYDSGAQTLDYVEFNTFAASATADKGEYRFKVDETLVATIDDGGIEIKASGSLSFGAVDILTDSSGTTTLANIDALDATTEATIESAIDTLSNLTTTGALNAGSITSGFGSIDNGSSAITTTGTITGGTVTDGTFSATSGAITGVTTLVMGGNLTNYEATNDGNPEIRLGAADAEELHIQSVYDSGAQTLDYVLFQTDAASGTADKGEYRFNVDGTLVATFDDGGLEVKASGSISFGAVDILTDSSGTTTLGNIDAIDATTEATIESAIDTLSNLTTTGALNSGSITTGFGAIDIGTSDFTTGGQYVLDVDGSAHNAAGAITFGAGNDGGIFHDGSNLRIETQAGGGGGIIFDSEDDTFEFKGSGTLQATFDTSGLNLVTGDAYYINSTSVLNATTLGSSVVASSLTSVGTLSSLTIGSGGMSILVGTSSDCNINFGDTDDADIGQIKYAHSTNSMSFMTNTAVALTIDSNGYLGISQASPTNPLHISSNVTGISDGHIRLTDASDAREATILNRSGDLELSTHGTDNVADSKITIFTSQMTFTTSGTTAVTISTSQQIQFHGYGAGTLVTDSSGNITASSDGHLKENCLPYNRGLSAIIKLTPRSYQWKESTGYDTKDTYYGFIAQEVETVLPEAINYKEDDLGNIVEGSRTFSDRALLAAIVNSIKELNDKIG